MVFSASRGFLFRPGAVLALLFAAALFSSGCGAGQHPAPAGTPDAGAYRGVVLMPPLEPPAFALRDTSGAPFDFQKGTAGAITILYFAQTACGDPCQSALSELAEAISKLPPGRGQPVRLAFLALDSEPGASERLRAWLGHLSAPIVGLMADPADAGAHMEETLGSLWVSRAPAAQPGQPAAGLFLIYTPDGAAHLAYKQEQATAETWEHDLPKLLREAAWGCH